MAQLPTPIHRFRGQDTRANLGKIGTFFRKYNHTLTLALTDVKQPNLRIFFEKGDDPLQHLLRQGQQQRVIGKK
jgi:hypothetical protein